MFSIFMSNIDGNNLLHLTLESGLLDLASYFIKKGIDVNKKNKYGESPLHLACSNYFHFISFYF